MATTSYPRMVNTSNAVMVVDMPPSAPSPTRIAGKRIGPMRVALQVPARAGRTHTARRLDERDARAAVLEEPAGVWSDDGVGELREVSRCGGGLRQVVRHANVTAPRP